MAMRGLASLPQTHIRESEADRIVSYDLKTKACSRIVSSNGGFWWIHENSNLALSLSGFEKDRNLVSFVLGEVCVHSRQL